MRRLRLAVLSTLLAAYIGVMVYAASLPADSAPTIPVVPNGAAGGQTPAMVLNGWDIQGLRNLQGGWLSGTRGDLNLDIGAGSTENPGDLVLNYDVGRRTLIYDGQKHLVASFGPDGIKFYVRPQLAYPHQTRKHRRLWWRPSWRR